MKSNMESKFTQNLMSDINNSTINPKLRTYKIFKFEHRLEPYLSILHNKKYQRYIAQFRVSSHKLGIEVGRYQKPPITLKERICKHCPGDNLDDELHLITECSFHTYERQQLFISAIKYIADFNSLDKYGIFKEILSSKIVDVLEALGRFLYISFTKRNA